MPIAWSRWRHGCDVTRPDVTAVTSRGLLRWHFRRRMSKHENRLTNQRPPPTQDLRSRDQLTLALLVRLRLKSGVLWWACLCVRRSANVSPGPPIFVALKLKPGVVSKEDKWPVVPLKKRRNEENCYSFKGQREINFYCQTPLKFEIGALCHEKC